MFIISFYKKWGIYIFLLVEIIIFSILTDNFLTWNNMMNIIRQSAMLGIVVVGVSFVMICGGSDLSVGGQIAVNGIISALLMIQLKWNPVIVCICALIIGMLMGAVNGIIVVKLRIQPLVVTLGTMTILQAIAYIVTSGKPIYGLPEGFSVLGQGYMGPIPVPVIVFLAIALIASFVLKKTYFGRYIYATGGNSETARLAGVNIKRLQIIVYAICGFVTAISSLIMLSRVNSAQPAAGATYAFDCMTAAVLGGVSFSGGEGKVSGAVIGVIIIAVLGNALVLMNVNEYYQNVFKGILLIFAVALDNLQIKDKRLLS
ncbi:MAG: ABC transporter permease [Lachnospiraceae bacterium]|jgi:ribose transport system permease protein|nr:hypothetical protein C819_03171 [Lachnospiraceae bacterium 10-1]MCX4350168.1 ABC transporter permease [Lachnospiraceae bacterium]